MSSTTSSGPAAPVVATTVTTSAPTARERLVIAVVCLATVLVIGCVAAVNLAAPDLARSSLRPSGSQLLWVVDLYVILFACLVIPGRLRGR